MTEFKYTPSQQAAIDAFDAFLKDKDSNVFILKGAAGTGKTTITRRMVDATKAKLNNANSDIALMAPTGRAAFILGQRTGHIASTIHRAIYYIDKTEILTTNDGDDSDIKFRFDLVPIVPNTNGSTVFFVDEASMVSNIYTDNDNFIFGTGYLLNDLMNVIRNHKIVFIGDYAQLPPVGMKFSPALSAEYLTEKYGVKCTEAMLTEVVRQDSGNAIIDNAIRLRDAIDRKNFLDLNITTGNDVSGSESLVDDLMRCDSPISNKVLVTYTNTDARDYNLEIRRRLYGENVPRIVIGDLLVVARNYYLGSILYNGTIVRVDSLTDCEQIVTRTVNIPLKQKENGKTVKKPIELRFRPIWINSPTLKEPETVYILDNFLDDGQASLSRDLSVALYIDFKIRNKHLRPNTQDFKVAISQDPFYNCLLCKYGYALTCHKAQGGEWDNVFVNMARNGGKANEDYFRWTYTAVTRAAKHLWVANVPTLSAIGNMDKKTITKGGKFAKYTPTGIDFKALRFASICDAASALGLHCSEDLSYAYEHRIDIQDDKGEFIRFRLRYGNKGYSSVKPDIMRASSDEFVEKCMPLISAEYVPSYIPFEDNGCATARQMHDRIMSVAESLDIKVMNIERKQYQDVYHLLTDGHAVVGFIYNGKGQYTTMNPQSDLGDADAKLAQFCDSL